MGTPKETEARELDRHAKPATGPVAGLGPPLAPLLESAKAGYTYLVGHPALVRVVQAILWSLDRASVFLGHPAARILHPAAASDEDLHLDLEAGSDLTAYFVDDRPDDGSTLRLATQAQARQPQHNRKRTFWRHAKLRDTDELADVFSRAHVPARGWSTERDLARRINLVLTEREIFGDHPSRLPRPGTRLL